MSPHSRAVCSPDRVKRVGVRKRDQGRREAAFIKYRKSAITTSICSVGASGMLRAGTQSARMARSDIGHADHANNLRELSESAWGGRRRRHL